MKESGATVHSVVCDPPYEIGYMESAWDKAGVAFEVETWRGAFEVLKPGGFLVAFAAPRMYHRVACAVEDAGFVIADQLAWVHGNGYPKSRDISKDLDRMEGHERPVVGVHQVIGYAERNVVHGTQRRSKVAFERRSKEPVGELARAWWGWGSALKPCIEPIILAQRPCSEPSIAKNVALHGVGALNIGACLVAGGDRDRWPAALMHDGSEDVLDSFQSQGAAQAARFFFCPRVDAATRKRFTHPTIKPLDLMKYLVRLVTPPGGTVLDIFAGTGTTGEAALLQGFNTILIEQDARYVEEIEKRLAPYDLFSFKGAT